MSLPTDFLTSSTRPLSPALVAVLKRLQPGQMIRLTQSVRVGRKRWTTVVIGTFRALRYLETGLATERVPEDDVVAPTIHFRKDTGEFSSIILDENTHLEILEK